MSDLSPIQGVVDKLASDIDAFKANQARDLQTISDLNAQVASLQSALKTALNPPTDPDVPVIADLAQQILDINAKLSAG